jgi:hypothetical protein
MDGVGESENRRAIGRKPLLALFAIQNKASGLGKTVFRKVRAGLPPRNSTAHGFAKSMALLNLTEVE